MGIPISIPGYRSRVPYIYAHALELISEIRMRTRDASHIADPSELKGTNHVRPVSDRLCIIFMACSCPNFVLGRLKKKKKKKRNFKKKKMEKIAVFPFSVYNSSDVF